MIELFLCAAVQHSLDNERDVQHQASVWSSHRNRRKATIRWTFNHTDAGAFPELYRHELAG